MLTNVQLYVLIATLYSCLPDVSISLPEFLHVLFNQVLNCISVCRLSLSCL